MVQSKGIEGRTVRNGKNSLQAIERAKRDELTSSVRCVAWHRRAGKNKAWTNRARQDWTDPRTDTAVVRRNQRITAGQGRSAATRSKESKGTRAANARRITGGYECGDNGGLRRSEVAESARNRIEPGDYRNCGRASEPLGYIAGKEARLV